MEAWLEWARGPLFRFALAVMILGLGRLLFLSGLGIVRAARRASDRNLPLKAIFTETLGWLLPVRRMGHRPIYSLTSVLFHIGLIVTPVFLGAHVMLWKRGIGLEWPALSHGLAEVLTLLTIVTGIGLTLGRVANPFSRALSSFEDLVLPPLLTVPFISGFLAMHPPISPWSYPVVMLVHVLSANLIMILIPFTKMAHCVLLPTTQLVGELGWRFPADQGEKVGAALGKQSEPV